MQRRTLLSSLAATTLATPRIARAAPAQVLRFVPATDLGILDPIWTTAYGTRNHGYMVFDTLYGLDESYRPQPQMLQGHAISDNGRRWTLTLREGLLFHDNTPVLARDVVASLRRWGSRDTFGLTLMAATDQLTAISDRVVEFRLKSPFPLLPDALGKAQTNMPCIMPERLARLPASDQVPEMIGSGPYRFRPAEQMSGSRYVWERFEGYVPRADGVTSFTAGPKRAYFDRVEWIVIPDPATAAAALQKGEVDWVEQPISDLTPSLRKTPGIRVETIDPTGSIGDFRLNHLHPPFDNPSIRRALLAGVEQSDFMQAAVGTDPAMWREGVGLFCPGTPFANDADIAAVTAPRDYQKVKAALNAAGYNGERVVLLGTGDYPTTNALGQVAFDTLKKCGFNVDFQVMDWASVQKRRTSKAPIDQGGWNAFAAFGAGLDYFNPYSIVPLRADGDKAWVGWPTSPRIEELRAAWLGAPDLEAQKRICRDLQSQLWQDVPYIPAGQCFQPTAYRDTLTGVLRGFPLFHNVRRTS